MASLACTELCLQELLLPTAFLPTSRLVLRYAVAIAKHFGSKIHLVHVITPRDAAVPTYPVPIEWESQTQVADRDMAALLASVSMADIPCDTCLQRGQLWPVLSDYCETNRIDMILLGTDGHSGLTKLLLGSSAEEIIRSANCPVLTIGPNCADPVDCDFKPRQLLCATDLLPGSRGACAYAASLAEEFAASLTFLHAVGAGESAEASQAAATELRRQVRILPALDGQPQAAILCLVEFGPSSKVILKAIEEQDADLVVLSARHAHPLFTAHVGSTTIHHVLARSPCPVLTLREDAN